MAVIVVLTPMHPMWRVGRSRYMLVSSGKRRGAQAQYGRGDSKAVTVP
jgi:hypothetical protein